MLTKNYENIIVNNESGVLIISVNRPNKLNALNNRTLSELREAFSLARNNDEIFGIILTGAGEKAFVSGADIKEFAEFDVAQWIEFITTGQTLCKFIEEFPKPVIAAVNGYAFGGGCEIAMACHIRVASVNARFCQPEVRLGIIPGFGGTQRLSLLIGKSKAMELILTGGVIGAEEAKALNLVNYVTAHEDLITKSIGILSKINSNSSFAVEKAIHCINMFFDKNYDGYLSELEEITNCVKHPDFIEGISAFTEKREPRFGRKN